MLSKGGLFGEPATHQVDILEADGGVSLILVGNTGFDRQGFVTFRPSSAHGRRMAVHRAASTSAFCHRCPPELRRRDRLSWRFGLQDLQLRLLRLLRIAVSLQR